MTSDQRDVTDTVLRSVREFLGGPTPDGDGWCFEFGEHLQSNWGAVYGGALAAGTLTVARLTVRDRSPRSLHLQILRSVPSGLACATAEVRYAGRTVATVQVEMFDSRRKLAVLALATMVTPDALVRELHNTAANRFQCHPRPLALVPELMAPVQHTLQMFTEQDGAFLGAYADNVRPCFDGTLPPVDHITVPWDDLTATGPEAACLAADAMVGAPVVVCPYIPNDVFGPNPDLTLRFTTAPAQREVLAAGTILSVQGGTVTVALEVQAGNDQLAQGLATSLLLRPT
jgi:acyl-coenzyme A thioesterase PaaI-like protein